MPQLHRHLGTGATGAGNAGVRPRKMTHGGGVLSTALSLETQAALDIAEFSTPEWMASGACASLTPVKADAIFFADGFYSEAKLNPAAAVLCGRCPVRQQCADYAISSETNVVGVWGGMTPAELREARLTRESQAA